MRALVSLGVILFLLLAILPYSASRVLSTEKVKNFRFHGKNTHQIHKNVNPFHVSKRKVPNGPDPIHNRRAETSRRSPMKLQKSTKN
ncbi:hypothetical protein EUTSA_v10028314mg [Eutrema salsugineum]|uniref:Uncharacterized protein n=1 Tax=Eutrema salsugineum TaxID=72664 RepID=V4L9F6_EUTSA|nr:hypothetical protein EUTSA_v10028314mg [Eutrema salsugineum]